MRAAFGVFMACVGLIGCRPSEPSDVPPVPPPATAAAATPPATPSRSPTASALVVPLPMPPTPVPAKSEPIEKPPRISITRPRSAALVRTESWERYAIEITHDGWLRKPGHRVAVVLDDFRVRYLDASSGVLRLGDLVPDDRGLSEGPHRLVAVASTASGQLVRAAPEGAEPVAVVHFWVGAKGNDALPTGAPEIVLVEPQGTYNGADAASGVRLEFLLLNAGFADSAFSVVAALQGQKGGSQITLQKDPPYRFSERFKSGDYTILLRLVDASAKGVDQVQRTITVNLDAPAP